MGVAYRAWLLPAIKMTMVTKGVLYIRIKLAIKHCSKHKLMIKLVEANLP